MPPWMAAMFIGFLIVGLRRDQSRHAGRLVLLVIIVLIGYEAAKIHAI